MIWEIDQEVRPRGRNGAFAAGASALLMLFIALVLPGIGFLVTPPEMPRRLQEVIVDIVRAKELELEKKVEQAPEEEKPVEERRPERPPVQRREVRERQPREQRRERQTPTTAQMQQELQLSLERQRTDRTRTDRTRSDTRRPDRETSAEVGLGTDRPSLEVGRGEVVRTERRETVRGERRPTGEERAALDMGDRAPTITIPTEPVETERVRRTIVPIIGWLEQNEEEIPADLKQQEYFNYQTSDVTSQVTFTDSEGNEYTMYLLGRSGNPPELKIFLISDGQGVLLQDLGAKGSSESFKIGRVVQRGDRMSIQMQQLSPSDQRAQRAMAIFQAWWESQS